MADKPKMAIKESESHNGAATLFKFVFEGGVMKPISILFVCHGSIPTKVVKCSALGTCQLL
ncbi:hypothetical protein [Butyrivibrio sp. VCD2006]|uniref:hypothetical protein n=1 Tax=Butyrivibrio sp. VCD2006 TaxID=1280664 RepID=UPI000479F122|nr:hypothetical protein [Butyrivibrio sp. VCD2006]